MSWDFLGNGVLLLTFVHHIGIRFERLQQGKKVRKEAIFIHSDMFQLPPLPFFSSFTPTSCPIQTSRNPDSNYGTYQYLHDVLTVEFLHH
jgi:hypothetical protein